MRTSPNPPLEAVYGDSHETFTAPITFWTRRSIIYRVRTASAVGRHRRRRNRYDAGRRHHDVPGQHRRFLFRRDRSGLAITSAVWDGDLLGCSLQVIVSVLDRLFASGFRQLLLLSFQQ